MSFNYEVRSFPDTNTTPQITEKQTMEALLLLAEDGNGEAKELVASIIKRLHPDVTNLFQLGIYKPI